MKKEQIFVSTSGNNPLEIVLPDGTVGLKRLDLKEIRILLNAAEFANNVSFLYFEFLGSNFYSEGLASRPAIAIQRETDLAAGDTLYNSYNHPINIIKEDSRKTTLKDKPIKIRILKHNTNFLQWDSIYLRFDSYYDVDPVPHTPAFISLPV